MKKLLLGILSTLFAACCFLAGCGEQDVKAEVSIELNTSSYVLSVGDFYQLTADVTGADDADVEWESSDPTYLTVNYDGRVTALKGTDGATVKVTASVGDASDSCDFEIRSVKNFPKLCIDTPEISVFEGGEFTLRPYVTYMDGRVDGITFGYEVADNTVCKIEDGVLTGIKQGQTTVTVSATYMEELLEEEIEVTVKEPEAFFIKQTEIVLNKSVVNTGDITETQLTVGYFNRPESTDVTWSSDNQAAVTVDDDGVIRAVGIGKAKITAVANYEDMESLTASVNVYVEKSVVAGVIDLGTLDLSGDITNIMFSDIGLDSYADDEVKVYDATVGNEYPAEVGETGVEIINSAVAEGYQSLKIELSDRIITVSALAISNDLSIPIAGSDGKASFYVLKDSGSLGSKDYSLTKEVIDGRDAYKFSMTGARRADPLRVFGVDSQWVKDNNIAKLSFKVMYPDTRANIGNVAIFFLSEDNVQQWAVSLHMAHEISQNGGNISIYDENGSRLTGVPSNGYENKWYTVEINLQNAESLDCKYDNLNIKIVDESNMELYIADATFLKDTTYTVRHHKSNGDGTYTLTDVFENVSATVGYNSLPIMDYGDEYYARQDVNDFSYYFSEDASENVFDVYYELKTVEVEEIPVSYLGSELDGVYFTADGDAQINLTEVMLDGEKAYSYTAFESGTSLTLKNIDASEIKAEGYNVFRIDIRTDSENPEQLIEDLIFKYGGGAAGVSVNWGGTIAEKAAMANMDYIRLYGEDGRYLYYYSLANKLINGGEWHTVEFTLPDPQNTENGVAIELYTNVVGRTIYFRNPTFAKEVESVNISADDDETEFFFGKAQGTENSTLLIERYVAGRKAVAYTANVNGWGLTFLNTTAEDIIANSFAKFRVDIYSPDASAYDLNGLQHTVSVYGLNNAFNRPLFQGAAGNEQYYRLYDEQGNQVKELSDGLYGQWLTLEYSVRDVKATLNDEINGFLLHIYSGTIAKDRTVYFSDPRFVMNDAMEISFSDPSLKATFGTSSQTAAGVRFTEAGNVAGKNAYALYDDMNLNSADALANAASVTVLNLTAEQIRSYNLQSLRIKVYSESAEQFNLANLFFKIYGGNAGEYRLNSLNMSLAVKSAAMYAADGRRIFDPVYGEWLTLEFNLADTGDTAYGGICVELYVGRGFKTDMNPVYFAEAEFVEKSEVTVAGEIAGAKLESKGANFITSVGSYAGKDNVYRYEMPVAKEVITLQGVTAEQLTEKGYTKFLIDVYSPSAETIDLNAQFAFMIAISGSPQWGYHTYATKVVAVNAGIVRFLDLDGNALYNDKTSLGYGTWYTMEIDISQKVDTLKGFIFELTTLSGGTSVYLANARFA